MHKAYILFVSIAIIGSCNTDFSPNNLYDHQDVIKTGRKEKMPGTHVSFQNFQYRVQKIESISVWVESTDTTNYYYSKDNLVEVEELFQDHLIQFSYSNDTVYNGPYYSIFNDEKLVAKYASYEFARVDKFLWDGIRLYNFTWGNQDYTLEYTNEGYLTRLNSRNLEYAYVYDENRVLTKVHIEEVKGENIDIRELEYTYNDFGCLSHLRIYRSYGLSATYKFKYDEIERLISIGYEAGPNIYELKYTYQPERGNALYLYHPQFNGLYPFDYYIGAILLNLPTIQ